MGTVRSELGAKPAGAHRSDDAALNRSAAGTTRVERALISRRDGDAADRSPPAARTDPRPGGPGNQPVSRPRSRSHLSMMRRIRFVPRPRYQPRVTPGVGTQSVPCQSSSCGCGRWNSRRPFFGTDGRARRGAVHTWKRKSRTCAIPVRFAPAALSRPGPGHIVARTARGIYTELSARRARAAVGRRHQPFCAAPAVPEMMRPVFQSGQAGKTNLR